VRSEKRKRLKVESRKSKVEEDEEEGRTAKARRVDDRDEGLGMKE
jgi:hypothetical protein